MDEQERTRQRADMARALRQASMAWVQGTDADPLLIGFEHLSLALQEYWLTLADAALAEMRPIAAQRLRQIAQRVRSETPWADAYLLEDAADELFMMEEDDDG